MSEVAVALASVLVSGQETDGQLSVVEWTVERGQEAPRHVHTREDEVVYVLEGHVSFYSGDTRLDLPVGASAVLPKGREHSCCVQSDRARLLHIFSPAGLEGAVAEWPESDAEHAIERLVATAARYGVEITGPPPQVGATAESERG